MKPKRNTSITEERFQRATEEFIELMMEETRQELIPRLRKKENPKKTNKNVAPVAAEQ